MLDSVNFFCYYSLIEIKEVKQWKHKKLLCARNANTQKWELYIQ